MGSQLKYILVLALILMAGLSMADTLDVHRYFQDPQVVRLAEAVQKGNAKGVQKELEKGVDVNAVGVEGFRPIFFAFFPEDAAVLKILLTAGAHPNVQLSNGDTPLHFAVRKKTSDFVAALLAAGADPKAKGKNGKPVIHEAIAFTNTENLALLVKAGADIDVVWAQDTPLYRALASLSWPMAAKLLALGADANVRNATGKTPSDMFCFVMARAQPTPTNRRPILEIFDEFQKRGIVLSCKGDKDRFAHE